MTDCRRRMKQISLALKEHAELCHLGTLEDYTNQDVLIANVEDPEIQNKVRSDHTISQILPSDQTIVRPKKLCGHSLTQKTSDQTLAFPRPCILGRTAPAMCDPNGLIGVV